MRKRCSGVTIADSSDPADTCATIPSISDAIGLDIPAENRGFCRKIALIKVDPDRGKPEMK